MKSSYQAIIFDWDGTLLDSTLAIAESLKEAATDLQLPILSRNEYQNIIGLGLSEALQTLYPSLSGGQWQIEMRERYTYHFRQWEQKQLACFDGVTQGLSQLREAGFTLAVATGKSRQGLNRALAAKSWDDLFEVTRCADETHSKPHPQMLWEILEVLQLQTHQALMVGDTEFDMAMASDIGMDCVAVSYGAHHLDRLQKYQPVLCVDHFSELVKWLQKSLVV
ncbi:HAD family hydrolase [Zooshikella sp. RANM57]|uniref:HAD family hydrolase n=1 Tax=Zooshikella sp. RANM57 TaxID=3425863 RepID=UPI003D6E5641